ncbi:hypothetical protein LAV_00154 [Sphingobium phage Lacusarx]|uniref:Uncharacterized protein n=1 Tax=Sphingobium phage Lacusarx TaxID=1980139 RepID=A0A1W6DXB8_9CAUD|nr:hypothetical protein FDH44_gp149 [Sphingobium phage Lacusarx]ARK07529.1 hypothetical protein LAV_00154 [Sphingobium phage Lacusarx]
MAREIQEPVVKTVENSPVSEMITTHPSFGQIAASRVSGRAALYGSDFVHQHYITIRLSESELHRNLSSDWHFPKRHGFIEVAMTEAQWATFVSSLNNGSGVPCTIQTADGKMIPGLPDPTPRTEQFGDEVREDLSDAVEALKKLMEEIDQLGLPKAKASKIMDKVRAAERRLSDSIPFVAKSFDKHMENSVEAAKAEVHGYMTGVLQRAGLEQLTGGSLPIMIEDNSDGRS